MRSSCFLLIRRAARALLGTQPRLAEGSKRGKAKPARRHNYLLFYNLTTPRKKGFQKHSLTRQYKDDRIQKTPQVLEEPLSLPIMSLEYISMQLYLRSQKLTVAISNSPRRPRRLLCWMAKGAGKGPFRERKTRKSQIRDEPRDLVSGEEHAACHQRRNATLNEALYVGEGDKQDKRYV